MESSKIEKQISEIKQKVKDGKISEIKAEMLIKVMEKKLNSKIVEK